VNPITIDARTEITTQLLSDEGYSVLMQNEDGDDEKHAYYQSDFEKKFFSENTNRIFCKTFIENAFRDPVTKEIGKTIIFCVRQHHAAKITQILNEFADKLFPGKYNSDFAVQVTSSVDDPQQLTINFTNNNLNGSGNFDPMYKTSKTRVCVTVGMMTTGYDCPDLLNVCLMRPIFSPTDFIQIKGRGTRRHNFLQERLNPASLESYDLMMYHESKDKNHSASFNPKNHSLNKRAFKLFDFFANCEYFEKKFNYDEVLKLPVKPSKGDGSGEGGYVTPDDYDSINPDPLKTMVVSDIGLEGMKIDRMYFDHFEETVKEDAEVKRMIEQKDLNGIEQYILQHIFDKPEEYYNLAKLRSSMKVDRRLTLREIIEKMLGYIPYFKSKDELLEDEFDKFDTRYMPDEAYFNYAKNFFKSYITDAEFREIIEQKKYALLNTNPNGNVFRQLPPELRALIPEYIKDNVSINKFMA
jgi:type I restriction enzyme R subunit